jgi:Fe-S-cluster containining protein
MTISGREWYFNEDVDSGKILSRLLVSNISNCQTRCMRCGTCCTKGGPTLHAEDRHIILEGLIGTDHLITIRKGELAYSPIDETLRPVSDELIKIAGKGRGWECLFLNKGESSCMIYAHRPLECRLLKCWDTTELLSVICKDTLKRADIINPGDPILAIIEDHEKTCSVQKMETILSSFSEESDNTASLNKLGELVRKDLSIRAEAVSIFALPLAMELFILGRPLFALLSKRGISVQERHGEIHLREGSRNLAKHDTIDSKSSG